MSQSTDHLRSQLGRLADTVIVPIELADRARQHARRDRTRLVTVVALVVALVAAGSVLAIRNLVQIRSLPVVTYHMEFGLQAPTGTRQLGPVFVQNADLQTTVFQVTGDPYAVFRDLTVQLRRAGFAAASGPLICGTRSTAGNRPWTCYAGAERRTSRDDMVTMSMTVSVNDDPYQAELVIRTVSAPLVPRNPVPIYQGQMFVVPGGQAPVQPKKYQPGATAGTGPHDPTSNTGSFLRYPYGVAAVVPPFDPDCGSATGFMSLQSTAGSPAAAAQDYVSQLTAHGVPVIGRNDTWTELKGATETANVIVGRGSDNTGYLLLEYCER